MPVGQRPLGDAAAFREMLSPSTPAELAVAQRLQALLMEYENDTLDVHIVWQPAARTDWVPTTDAMARIWDRRAWHYWDREKTLRAVVGDGRGSTIRRFASRIGRSVS